VLKKEPLEGKEKAFARLGLVSCIGTNKMSEIEKSSEAFRGSHL